MLLILGIAGSFAIELALARPDLGAVLTSIVPYPEMGSGTRCRSPY
jgi:hypothetical protein